MEHAAIWDWCLLKEVHPQEVESIRAKQADAEAPDDDGALEANQHLHHWSRVHPAAVHESFDKDHELLVGKVCFSPSLLLHVSAVNS